MSRDCASTSSSTIGNASAHISPTASESRSRSGTGRAGKPRFNYRLIRTLHIYSSMAMLLVMLFFTLTGFTLNHRDWFHGQGDTVEQQLLLPVNLADDARWQSDPLQVAEVIRQWLSTEHGIRAAYVSYEWEADEQLLLIDMKRPGGRSSVELEAGSTTLYLRQQSKGTVALLNDLHMGRYSSLWWRLFIDFSAAVMLLFTLTGLWLVLPQKARRQRLFMASVAGLVVSLGAAVLAQVSF
ncbi:MAG: PepSY-associated TM helix domain-containing protein [Marinobacterium sp.]|nr:PepSY-associated TM helix domain-containing protein [Marinobacterium sp.]